MSRLLRPIGGVCQRGWQRCGRYADGLPGDAVYRHRAGFLRASMVDRLTKNIHAHGDHLTTGFLGTPFLLFVLDENQQTDLAFKLLLSDTYPSWGYMVKKDATTWWERWNGDTGDPSMNSYNHYAFGSVMAWVYRRAAGIDTDAGGPGFHHLSINPHFDPALPALHVEYDSEYGTGCVGLEAERASLHSDDSGKHYGDRHVAASRSRDDWKRDAHLHSSVVHLLKRTLTGSSA
jgi:hypothetical protein